MHAADSCCCCVVCTPLLLQERAVRDNLTFVSAYDDPYIIAGQGTAGDEILRQVRLRPTFSQIVVYLAVAGGWARWPHADRALAIALQLLRLEVHRLCPSASTMI
jgi:hypothetical protein